MAFQLIFNIIFGMKIGTYALMLWLCRRVVMISCAGLTRNTSSVVEMYVRNTSTSSVAKVAVVLCLLFLNQQVRRLNG